MKTPTIKSTDRRSTGVVSFQPNGSRSLCGREVTLSSTFDTDPVTTGRVRRRDPDTLGSSVSGTTSL